MKMLTKVTKLNAIREERRISDAAQDATKDSDAPEISGGMSNSDYTTTKNTRVDTMLVDVFYLLSLFFLTVAVSYTHLTLPTIYSV